MNKYAEQFRILINIGKFWRWFRTRLIPVSYVFVFVSGVPDSQSLADIDEEYNREYWRTDILDVDSKWKEILESPESEAAARFREKRVENVRGRVEVRMAF